MQELIGNSSKVNSKTSKTLIDLNDKKDLEKKLSLQAQFIQDQ
jgi:hypothetical protein